MRLGATEWPWGWQPLNVAWAAVTFTQDIPQAEIAMFGGGQTAGGTSHRERSSAYWRIGYLLAPA